MRNKIHPCYSCAAEAMTLCQRCTAKSCLDHLTATRVAYSSLLLCEECVSNAEQDRRNGMCLLGLLVFVFVVGLLASAQ